jgi:hypothetical protein
LEGGYKSSASNGVEGMRLKGVYHGGDGVDGMSIFGIALDGGTRDFALVRQLYGCLSSSVLDAMCGASQLLYIGRHYRSKNFGILTPNNINPDKLKAPELRASLGRVDQAIVTRP